MPADIGFGQVDFTATPHFVCDTPYWCDSHSSEAARTAKPVNPTMMLRDFWRTTLASYIALGSGGCSIGPVTVADFAYSAKASNGAQQIPPDQVQVSPSLAIPAAASLTFSANWQVTSGQTQDSFVEYTVVGAATASGELILQLGTYQVGFGTAVVKENTNVGILRVFATCGEVACNSKTTDTQQFSPPTVGLQVVDHVKLSATMGPTSLSTFSTKFDFCTACV